MQKRIVMLLMSLSMIAPALLGSAGAVEIRSAEADIYTRSGARQCEALRAKALQDFDKAGKAAPRIEREAKKAAAVAAR